MVNRSGYMQKATTREPRFLAPRTWLNDQFNRRSGASVHLITSPLIDAVVLA